MDRQIDLVILFFKFSFSASFLDVFYIYRNRQATHKSTFTDIVLTNINVI